MKRGQVSLEFLMIMMFAFLLLIPVIILFMVETNDINEDVTSAQIHKLADELQDGANNVYYLGYPTKKTLNIYIPKYIDSITFQNNYILFNMSTGYYDYNIIRFTAANISGSLDTNPGMHAIEISANSNGVDIQG
jgi:uncharacterized protein (UPF0333 family)